MGHQILILRRNISGLVRITICVKMSRAEETQGEAWAGEDQFVLIT